MLIDLSQIKGGKELKESVEAVSGKALVVDKFDSVTNGQVDFTLTQVPSPMLMRVLINSVPYIEGEDFFTVNREGKKVTWIFTNAKQGFDIHADFEVAIEYQVDTTDPAQMIAKIYSKGEESSAKSGDNGSFLLA